MSRAVFLGDSHTCGYKSIPGKTGEGSYEVWQDNNYAEQYSIINNKPTSVYAVSGACNSIYKDWLNVLFRRHKDIDEVFILLAPLNRFIIAFDKKLGAGNIPHDYFTIKSKEKDNIEYFSDSAVEDDALQLFNKPHGEDYSKFPGVDFTYEEGLKKPNIREHSFMEIKTFFDMNTHLEKRQFYQDIYTLDNMCTDNNAKLYLFHMTDRTGIPSYNDFYGKLKSTIISPISVEQFFQKRHIDHKKFYIEDKEHYNTQYHELIARDFIPWLKESNVS